MGLVGLERPELSGSRTMEHPIGWALVLVGTLTGPSGAVEWTMETFLCRSVVPDWPPNLVGRCCTGVWNFSL